MNRFTFERCFIVAEIGINHNGSFETAKEMVKAAKKCGANAVKLQVFTGDDFYWKDNEFTFGKNKQWKESVLQLFQNRKLDKDEIAKLYEYSKDIGILCFSTPLSFQWLDFLKEINNPIYKIASGDVTCIPFIEEIAKIKKPIILSTGMSYLSDVDKAVRTIQQDNSCKMGILHCVSTYPAPLNHANLKMIQTYSKLYDCIPGFSDHTEGILASSIAVALGAKIIEKHFTLDKNQYGPDHWFSMDMDDLKQLVISIRKTEEMLGNGRKTLLKTEHDKYIVATRCIVLNKFKNQGDVIEEVDLDYKRPCMGLRSEFSKFIIGKSLKRNIKKNQRITISDLDM